MDPVTPVVKRFVQFVAKGAPGPGECIAVESDDLTKLDIPLDIRGISYFEVLVAKVRLGDQEVRLRSGKINEVWFECGVDPHPSSLDLWTKVPTPTNFPRSIWRWEIKY